MRMLGVAIHSQDGVVLFYDLKRQHQNCTKNIVLLGMANLGFSGMSDESVLTALFLLSLLSFRSTAMLCAAGQSWGHACTNRVLLSWQGDVR